MGFFHLFNCVALATGPHIILYKTCGMKDHDAFWRCFKILLLYGFTQLLRMFLATLVHVNFDISTFPGLFNYEIMGILLNYLAVRLTYEYLVGRTELAVYIGSIGWACGDLVFTKYIPLWVGTRSLEFEWSYLSLSLDANFELIFYFTLFLSPWLHMRKERNPVASLVACVLFVISSFHTSIFGLFEGHFHYEIHVILAKLVFSVVLGLASLTLKVMWITEAPFEPRSSAKDRSVVKQALESIAKSASIGMQSLRNSTGSSGLAASSSNSGRKGGR